MDLDNSFYINSEGSDDEFSGPTPFSRAGSTGKYEFVENEFFLEIYNILITSFNSWDTRVKTKGGITMKDEDF